MVVSEGPRSIMACPADHEYAIKLQAVVKRMGLKEPCLPPKGKENYFCDPRILDPNLTPQQRKEVACEVRTGILTLLAQGRTLKKGHSFRSGAANQKMSIPVRFGILATFVAILWVFYSLTN